MKIKLNLNVLPKIRDFFAGLKSRLADLFSATGRKIVAVLHLHGIARFFKRAVRGVLDFFGNITDRVKGFFSACSRLVRRCFGAVKDFFSNFTAHVRRIPGHAWRLFRAALSWRPPERAWTLLISLVAMGVGGLLIMGPATELATGKSFRWEALVTVSWLLTGLCMLLGGMGVFLQTSTFRRYFAVAFVCSLPVAGAFGYKTLLFAQKLRTSEGADRELLTNWVSGGVQLSAVFLGVALMLFYFLRTRLLKSMFCYDGSGALGSSAVGAVQGGALAYLVWHVFRWLGFVEDIGWFVQAVYAVPIEFFVGGGALLGTLVNGYFGFRRKTPPPEPVAGGATGLVVGSGVGYLAWNLCQWLATAQSIDWCARLINSSRIEYFIGGGAFLCACFAVYRGLRARRGPAGWKPRATRSSGTRPTVSSATRAAVSGGTRPAMGGGTRPAMGSGTRPAASSGTQPAMSGVGSGTRSAVGATAFAGASTGTRAAVGSGTQSSGTQSSGTQSSGTQSSGTQSSGTQTAIDMDDLFD